MHHDKCGGKNHPGICESMDPYDGELLREYLLNVNFTGKDTHTHICVYILNKNSQ